MVIVVVDRGSVGRRWDSVLTMATLRPQLVYGLATGVSFSLSTLALVFWYYTSKPARKFDSRPIQLRGDEIVNGVTGLIGAPA